MAVGVLAQPPRLSTIAYRNARVSPRQNQFATRLGTETFDDVPMNLELDDIHATFGRIETKIEDQSRSVAVHNLTGASLKKAVMQKYNLQGPSEPHTGSSALDEGDIGDNATDSSSRSRVGDDQKASQTTHNLRRGFKYFLYHHHSLLGVVCVRRSSDLPRYARGFLFFFDLLLNLMFALVLVDAGMAIVTRLFLTVFLCLVIGIAMSITFKHCGFNKVLTGSNTSGKFATIFLLMVAPTAVVSSVVIAYLFRQHDGGSTAAILFSTSTALVLIIEVLVWYWMYACCKDMCGVSMLYFGFGAHEPTLMMALLRTPPLVLPAMLSKPIG